MNKLSNINTTVDIKKVKEEMLDIFSNSKKVNIKKISQGATIPTYGSNCAAGADLYSCNEQNRIIKPGHTEKFKTGIAMEIPEGYFGAIFARSGIATKQGLRPSNCVGVIDSDYRGDIIVPLHNDSNVGQVVTPHQRIAQIVLIPYQRARFNIVDELDSTERNEGGFGSTGSN